MYIKVLLNTYFIAFVGSQQLIENMASNNSVISS